MNKFFYAKALQIKFNYRFTFPRLSLEFIYIERKKRFLSLSVLVVISLWLLDSLLSARPTEIPVSIREC